LIQSRANIETRAVFTQASYTSTLMQL